MKYKKIDIIPDTIYKRTRSELMKECLKLGLPVRADDSDEVLELFLLIAKENKEFDTEYEDNESDSIHSNPIRLKSFIKKVFHSIGGFL